MMKDSTFIIAIILASLFVVGCGRRELPPQGSAAQSASGEATLTPVAAATPLRAQFKQPTMAKKEADPEEKEESTAEESTPTPEVDLSRGERTYNNKECGECHGPQGEGVTDKGGPLAGTELSEEEFTDILRTGGNGELGNDHLYGTQAISPSGMEALYAFVKSLGGP